MPKSSNQPVIIRRVEEPPEEGGHGGGWKVAYADFMTAMMAFFLLMWIIAASDEEKVRGLADYFTPSIVTADGAGEGLLKGEAMEGKGTRGAPPSDGKEVPTFGQDNPLAVFDSRLRETEPRVVVEYEPRPDSDSTTPALPQEAPAEAGTETPQPESTRRAEELDSLRKSVETSIRTDPELAPLAEHVQMEVTPEGLAMQVVDHERRSMFASGSARIEQATRDLIGVIGQAIRDMPNPVVVTGHTDAVPFASEESYGNWELSADRANATRRVLLDQGVAPARIERISGLADTDPLMPGDPEAPENRRISVLLRYPEPPAASPGD